jgi:putative oxidoreductase
MDSLRSTGALLGRIMLASIFVQSGIEKISGPADTMRYMASAGLPHSLVPGLFALSVVVELLGGLMLIFGWYAELAALGIFLWMIPVTIIFHVSTGQTVEWEKNVAIMGGLLMVAVLGPGGFSLGPVRGGRPEAGALRGR